LHISLKSKHAHAPQHTHAQKITKHSGEAERSGKGGFGGLLDFDAHSTPTQRSENNGENESEFKQSKKV
jgi:hypothetical protein